MNISRVLLIHVAKYQIRELNVIDTACMSQWINTGAYHFVELLAKVVWVAAPRATAVQRVGKRHVAVTLRRKRE